MINIKDKLNRTNILIKRTNTEAVEYVPREEYNEVLGDVNAKIEEIDEVISATDYITKDELNAEIYELNAEIDELKNNIENSIKGVDFSVIGYDLNLSNIVNQSLIDEETIQVMYSKELGDTWDPSNTSASILYRDDYNIKYAPAIDTSNVTNASGMYCNCQSLISIPELNFANVTNITNFFSILTIGIIPILANLKYLGGFKDLKVDWKDNYGLVATPYLTYQSLINILNNLYNFRKNGDSTTTKTLKMNSQSLAILSEEDVAMATAKGWVITA